MKNKFYVYNENQLVDLKEESKILLSNWGNRFNVKHTESVAYHEIYTRQDYFRGDCIISPGDVVVDCGSNIGIFTSLAFDMGASIVLSYEAYEDNCVLNRKNNPNAKVFNLAVSNKNDEIIELLCSEYIGGHSIMESEIEKRPNEYKRKNVFLKTITLDEIISQNFIDHIDFLKIDTEGAELLILEGLSDNNLDKIKNISLEYHHSVFNYDEEVYNKFQKRFLERGFNVFTHILDKNARMVYISKGDVFK